MRNRRTTSNRRKLGQTLSLIETLVIVAIIAILASILIPKYLTVRQQSQVGATESQMKNIAEAFEMYYSVNNAYPSGSGTVNPSPFGGTANNFFNGKPTSPNGGGYYTYTTQATSPLYYIDDPGTYPSYLIANLPKAAAGSDSSTGLCNTNCTNIEWNPDLGFTGH